MRESIASWIARNRSSWSLASDAVRMTIAAISASFVQLVLAFVLVDLLGWLPEETRSFPVDLYLWFFLCCISYVVLSQLAFGKHSSEDLRSTLKRTRPAKRGPVMAFLYGESGTSHATMFSFVALASVAMIGTGAGIAEHEELGSLLYASALLTVVGAWISNVASFAVQYAREDADSESSQFEFPDTDAPIWSDYIYTAVMVSASLSTGDVTVRSRARRKLVAINTVVAFTFNTVIIAMLIAAIM